MLSKFICTVFILPLFFHANTPSEGYKAEYWGFCTAVKDKTIYISSVITYPIADAQLGFPNTKVIRRWRLIVKDELGDDYSEKWNLEMEYRYCAGATYHSRLEADEGKECFISKAKKEGKTVKYISFTY